MQILKTGPVIGCSWNKEGLLGRGTQAAEALARAEAEAEERGRDLAPGWRWWSGWATPSTTPPAGSLNG